MNEYTKKVRYSAEVEGLLKQFSKCPGKSDSYRRGHAFAFEFSQEQRDAVNKLMETGMTFDEAFDDYSGR